MTKWEKFFKRNGREAGIKRLQENMSDKKSCLKKTSFLFKQLFCMLRKSSGYGDRLNRGGAIPTRVVFFLYLLMSSSSFFFSFAVKVT